MLVVVGLVSFLVHVYSLGYMKGEVRYGRFFAYLGIFSFSMLGLVLSGNLLFLFLFWELVGFSSYLLIGFYFEKDSAADACKKAFLVNKVGDTGLFIGMMILFAQTGTFDILVIFERISQAVAENGGTVPGWFMPRRSACLAGPISKSAQFPLHVWLPDAMEGPTPVSALIHAATMVAAGVYLIARMFPMYLFVPEVLLVVAIFGAFTAILRGDDWLDAVGHQEGARLLDSEPARLHDCSARLRRPCGGLDAPDDARVVQGRPLPLLGLGHPRHASRAGHARDGRSPQEDARHLRDDAHLHHGDCGGAALLRLLQQGRDHCGHPASDAGL
jgi:hypothetical protein